jgi:gamma-glutamylputrescine oxidase
MSLLSLWEKETYYAKNDVIIVGGGLMGLWTAVELIKQHPLLKITILERHVTPLGASTRNAGFACFGSLTELLTDEASMGTEAMLQMAAMRYNGIQKIKRLINEDSIDLDPCGGYEPLLNYHSAELLEDQIQYLNHLLQPITGKHITFSNATAKIESIGLKNFDHLVYNPLEAGIHSGKLVQHLTKIALAKGVHILNGITVESWNDNNHEVELFTNSPISLKASTVIVCTNGFTPSLIPELNIEPARGQILLTKPIKDLRIRGTFHFDEGFYYWRNVGNRILLGGARNSDFENERTTNLDGSDFIRETLFQFIQNHFNLKSSVEIEQSWSGIMAFTPDKLPICKKVSTNIVTAIACNGMGVALTPIVAESVIQHINP